MILGQLDMIQLNIGLCRMRRPSLHRIIGLSDGRGLYLLASALFSA